MSSEERELRPGQDLDPLDVIAGADAPDLVREFIDTFVSSAGISAAFADDLQRGLEISASVSEVAVDFPILGLKGGLPWDGSLGGLRRALAEAAEEFGAELQWERENFGPTQWD